jgi:hypothetical protein
MERHAYKRGRFAGDAPADYARRGKTHFRLIHNGTEQGWAVRFHRTDIVTIKPDGTVIVNTEGWHESRMTREAVWEAMNTFTPWYLALTSNQNRGVTQTMFVLRSGDSHRQCHPFFDGLTVRPDGVAQPHPVTGKFPGVQRRVRDTDEVKEFTGDPDVIEFRKVLPVLHAARVFSVEAARSARDWHSSNRRLTEACWRRENWPDIVYTYWRDTPAQTWTAYFTDATKYMYKIVED